MINLKEKYASVSDKPEDKENKKVLSDDAYAICEFIQELSSMIDFYRRSK